MVSLFKNEKNHLIFIDNTPDFITAFLKLLLYINGSFRFFIIIFRFNFLISFWYLISS